MHKNKICLKLLLATLYEVAIFKTTPKQLLFKLNQNYTLKMLPFLLDQSADWNYQLALLRQ